MGIFPYTQGQLTPQSKVLSGRISNPSENFMVVLVICMNEEDPIKNEGARVVTTLFIDFSDAQGQLTPKSVMESCQNSKLIQAFMVGLVTCKNEEDPSKNDCTRLVTIFLPL